MVTRVAIIGCGLIGHKRARALGDCRLVAAADRDPARAHQLAGLYPGCVAESDWRPVVARDDVDLVIVATTNDALAAVTRAAVRHAKRVLVEKPAARAAAELAPVAAEARRAGVVVKVGFNHRFHPALLKAHALFKDGAIGPLLYLRGRYGHGGRKGYDREWRADPAVAGGGELLDQGVHLIDLARWFAGDFAEVDGHACTAFWDMPVEDNGFLLLRTAEGRVAWLHATWTEWKNTFSFEITGRDAKLHIEGLGGSYGVERLSYYKMKPAMGPPETTIWEYPGEDNSWRDEFAAFTQAIAAGRSAPVTLRDAHAALTVVHRVYAASRRP
jgi:predicted dehydrogenase